MLIAYIDTGSDKESLTSIRCKAREGEVQADVASSDMTVGPEFENYVFNKLTGRIEPTDEAAIEARKEWKKIERVRGRQLVKLEQEYEKRIKLYTDASYKGEVRQMNLYLRRVRREIAGTANAAQLLFLNVIDQVNKDKDTLTAYIERENRTLKQLQDLDVTDDSHWTDPR